MSGIRYINQSIRLLKNEALLEKKRKNYLNFKEQKLFLLMGLGESNTVYIVAIAFTFTQPHQQIFIETVFSCFMSIGNSVITRVAGGRVYKACSISTSCVSYAQASKVLLPIYGQGRGKRVHLLTFNLNFANMFTKDA